MATEYGAPRTEDAPYPGMCGIFIAIFLVRLYSLISFCCCRDDAVFDDSLIELFPKYWDMTPRDFDFVFVGHIIPGQPVREPTVEGEAAPLNFRSCFLHCVSARHHAVSAQ